MHGWKWSSNWCLNLNFKANFSLWAAANINHSFERRSYSFGRLNKGSCMAHDGWMGCCTLGCTQGYFGGLIYSVARCWMGCTNQATWGLHGAALNAPKGCYISPMVASSPYAKLGCIQGPMGPHTSNGSSVSPTDCHISIGHSPTCRIASRYFRILQLKFS